MTDIVAIVVNWETRDLLLACLERLERQRDVPLRVVVVDNASTDGSPAAVRRLHPDVDLMALSVNVGYTRATNMALRRIEAPLVLLCNPDCLLTDDCVARLVRTLEANPRVGAVAPRLLGSDRRVQVQARRFPTLVDTVFVYTDTGVKVNDRLGKWWTTRRFEQASARDAKRCTPVMELNAACVLVRRELLVAGLDEGFPLFFSDTDLWWRLGEDGWLICLEPGATAEHAGGASIRKVAWAIVFHELQRGVLRFYRLHRPRWRRLVVEALMLGDVAVRGTVAGVRQFSAAPVRAEFALFTRIRRNEPAPGAPWDEDAAP